MSRNTASLTRLAARALCTLALIVASATLALASPGTIYMNGGLTTPAGAIVANGQVWVSDSTLGFCRIAPNVAGVQLIIGSTCFINGTSEPTYDPVHNVAYVGDLAGKTGVWRLQFDAASQNILTAVDIVPGTSVQANVPVGVALGPDGKLYVGFRASSSIIRVTNPTNDTPGAQLIEQVGLLQAGRGVNALAFRGNDLWIADRNFIDHMDNATLCTGGCTAVVVGGTTAIPNGIVSDGTRYVYIAVGAAVIRYDGNTGVFDTLSTSAIDNAGLPTGYGFVWGLGYRASDGTLLITTDVFGPLPAGIGRRGAPGGPPPGTGSIFKLTRPFTGEGAVIDPLTLQAMALTGPFAPPNVPLTPAATSYVTGVTNPRGMAVIDGHLWVSDRFVGLCRVDINGAGQPILSNVCAPGTTGTFIPGQPVATFTTNPVTGVKTVNHVFVPDLAQSSQGVWRFDYNPVSQSLSNPITAISGLNGPSSLALGSDGNLYIGFFASNQVNRILTPDTNPTLDKGVGTTVDGGGVRSLAFINNDLYLAETSNVTLVPLATSRSKPIQAIRFGDTPGVVVKGFVSRLTQGGALALTSDGTDKLYMGVPVDVQAFSASVPQQYDLANRGFDGTNETPFVNATAVAWDGANTLYVAEDAFGLASPQSGHIWAVTLPWNKPLVPSYLQAITVTDGSVQLKWHDWSKSETNFTIQRQTVPADGSAPAPFADLVNLVSDTLGTAVGNDFYTDTTVTPGTTYNYQIMASGPSGDSPYTVPGATATVLALPPAASDLASTFVNDIRVDLAWTDNSQSELGFRVERANDAAFTTGLVVLATAPADSTALSDTTVSGGNTYYYRVIAFSANGDGASSNVIGVATPVNHPPVITNPGNQITINNSAVSMRVLATDADFDLLTFTTAGLPAGLSIDPTTGSITGTVTTPGLYNVQVTVTDGRTPVSTSFTWSVAITPVPVSSTPSSGQGQTQTFQFTFNDAVSGSFLKTIWANISTSTAYPGSCAMTYDVLNKKLTVIADDGSHWLSPALTPGLAGTAANSQCSISGAGLTATANGNQFVLSVPVTFNATYTGQKNIYIRAANKAALDSNWQLKGTWLPTASAQTPSVVSVTPSAGSGATQSFQFTFSDVNGYKDLKTLYAQVGSSSVLANSCSVIYDAVQNLLFVASDDGSSFLGGVTPGTAATVQNSRCTLNAATSSAVGSGNSFTLTAALNFASSFTGPQNIYGRVVNAGNVDSSAVLKGSWTPNPVPVAPTVSSVTPNVGTGLAQTFQLVLTDPNGFKDIATTFLQVSTSTAYPNSCAVKYDAVANRLYLINDAGNGWLPALIPGSATTVSNSQCQISGASTSVIGSGSTLTLNLAITFTNYSGAKNIYGRGVSVANLDSGWKLMGTWTPQ